MSNESILENYIRRIEGLRGGQRGHEGPAPHRPLLLLVVIDLISLGKITKNRIFPSPDLAEIFLKYWSSVAGNRKPNLAMPFFHLKSTRFWHLHPHPGKKAALKKARKIRRMPDLVDIVHHATLDDELFTLLTNVGERNQIRKRLINKHFPAFKQVIETLFQEEEQIGEYRQLLIGAVAEGPFTYQTIPEPVQATQPVRRAAFRQEIMQIYDYTCAVCRLRIVTMHGESATDAAHIIPFSISQNDDIRNGISLCKLHHWAFDKGLISLNRNYKVMVSALLSERRPTEWVLTEQRDKSILLPEHDLLYPAQDALKWHRDERFRE